MTIVLVGLETQGRKHVDWEIYSSMIDGAVNKKSGVLVINLPSIKCTYFRVSHEGEKEAVYPEVNNWTSINDRAEYEARYPYMPDRIIDQLCCRKAKVSVAPWSRIEDDPSKLSFLIEAAFEDRVSCEYDLKRPMRWANS